MLTCKCGCGREIIERPYHNNHPMWKGGQSNYVHRKAWELFGQDKCEICGITYAL